jgi:hypothetical protein
MASDYHRGLFDQARDVAESEQGENDASDAQSSCW